MVGVDHHARDLGKILVQAQSDLAQIRSSIAAEGGVVDSRLLAVVERVEAEMRMKADAVLQTVVHGSPATLPSLGAYNFGGASSSSSVGSTARAHVGDPSGQRSRLQLPQRTRSAPSNKAQTKRQQQQLAAALVNPASDSSRAYLAERFGVAAPPPRNAASGSRPVGKKPSGKLTGGKISAPLGVVGGEHRRDPGSAPPIRPRDVAAGLLSLTQRGLLPPHLDLTPALAREPAPVTQAPSRLHDPKSAFAASASAAYTSPFGFSVANTRCATLRSGHSLTHPKKLTRVAAPSPRASLGRYTVCRRTEQRRPPILKRYETKENGMGEFSYCCSSAQNTREKWL